MRVRVHSLGEPIDAPQTLQAAAADAGFTREQLDGWRYTASSLVVDAGER